MHALIIEDESTVAFTIEGILRECGFTSFDIAPSAHAAIVAAALRKPDIITADLALKPGCGIATLEAISDGPAIPTVFITGNPADVARLLPNSLVLEKPFAERELIAAVAAAMMDVSDDDVRKTVKPKFKTVPRAGAR